MKEYQHGGEIYNKQIDLDFSVNTNPFGLPEGVKQALIEHMNDFTLYPDDNCTVLREALADSEKVNKENIICGNGASDLIFRICYSVRPKKAVLLSPTFSEYEKALLGTGCSINYYNLEEAGDFRLTADFIKCLDETVDILFLCNPNNPVGNRIDYTLLIEIAQTCKKYNIVLVVDECFLDFTENGKEQSLVNHIKEYNNLFILRAFTKFYAMAGLRLGYGFSGNVKLLENMQLAGPAWNVSVPAQIAGIAALKEVDYANKTFAYIKQERNYLYNALKQLKLKVYEPEANYLFFKAKETLYEEMLEKRILIRHCDNYRQLDKNYYRIAVKNHDDNKKLVDVMKECIRFL